MKVQRVCECVFAAFQYQKWKTFRKSSIRILFINFIKVLLRKRRPALCTATQSPFKDSPPSSPIGVQYVIMCLIRSYALYDKCIFNDDWWSRASYGLVKRALHGGIGERHTPITTYVLLVDTSNTTAWSSTAILSVAAGDSRYQQRAAWLYYLCSYYDIHLTSTNHSYPPSHYVCWSLQ